jgi:homoserine dehydrogenase
MGGLHPAYDFTKAALEAGKSVCTSNKELVAEHGPELIAIAHANNVNYLFEASCGGGIPIIRPLNSSLTADDIDEISGILNGTTNYILTKMDVQGASYSDVLKESQELGYAEADPTGDVEGFDAAYKITTLATIAFGQRIKFENVYREGITKIRPEDMKAANEMGYKIKLIASAEINRDGKADVRVHPMLVPKSKTLAHIDYVTNAISLSGYPVGDVTLSGPGAGEFPTASSVVGDILAIASELGTTDYILPMMRCNHNQNAEMIDISLTENKYYISITTQNSMGVIGRIGKACEENNISLASIVQKEVGEGNFADITVITELCREMDMQNVINIFNADPAITKVNSLIRVQI